MQFDLRTLNIHLALRVQEILACSETMWAWVLGRQASYAEHEGQRRPRSDSKTSLKPKGALEEELVTLSRQEFDLLLDYFELCVRLSLCMTA